MIGMMIPLPSPFILHLSPPTPTPTPTPYSVIRRLVTLINERARLEASETAAIKQAQSASAEVKRLMEREEVEEEEEGKKVRKGRNGEGGRDCGGGREEWMQRRGRATCACTYMWYVQAVCQLICN